MGGYGDVREQEAAAPLGQLSLSLQNHKQLSPWSKEVSFWSGVCGRSKS